MQKEQTLTLPALVVARTTSGSFANNLFLVLGASMLIAVSAQIAIPVPFSPVPMTLQPLAILLVGAVLGSTRGAAAVVAYLLEGAAGLPVFAGGHAGLVWVVAGATAGYLLAFPLAAWIVGKLSEHGWSSSVTGTVLMMLIGLLTIHLGGWAWLASVAHLGAEKAFLIGSAPFLMGDVVKIGIAAAILPTARRWLSRFAG